MTKQGCLLMKTAIVTDSNSGITQEEAKKFGISVVPMPVLIDGEIYYEDLTLSQEQFYEKLTEDTNVSTSQPNPLDVAKIWDEALKNANEVVYIPMSSGLSETCHTLAHFAQTEERFKGKVFVVDNQRISVTQRQSVLDAIKLANEGKTGAEISKYLLDTKMLSSIYIMIDTLKYLKKGGRLTPAAAAIGTLLKIKPVLQIQGEKLDSFAKVRKVKDAKTVMIDAIKKDFDKRFKDVVESGKMTVSIAHTQNLEEAQKFAEEIKEAFPNAEFTYINPLSLSVSCHIGPGALAVACAIKY